MRAAALLFLAACATTDGTDGPLPDDEADNVATAIASTLRPLAGGGELGAMQDAAALVRGQMPAGFQEDDGTVRGQHAGFAFAYRLACRDDHNQAVSCDARTANADIDVSWSGVLESAALVSVASREGAWILNDITEDRLRLDGDSHFEYASAHGGDRHELAYDASYRNVVLVRDERWPRGGLVRYEITTSSARQIAHALTVDARFHASGRATIVLPDHEYELDLTTGSLVRAR